ncbi:MFS general substrate transporter [Coniophora puteana RWD-64-598 SS2]|uniref:MFS general substrate transporter n=1 Tax=Coniophora puteana (strain RWD-64-598) TaxID=741705 RepID=A0A5M3MTG8_CONPW|nr:MFS general substrate transporter [Coniophora puteana RWD-64-598 SS2]EIW82380.1 MFS general substrate transporter [Coniophora puteana RWD-64-598 SS2]
MASKRIGSRNSSANVEKASQPEVFDDTLVGIDSFESADVDEALQLVGTQASEHFSKEYNIRLRKKLDRYIPPICAAVYFCQFLDKTSLNYARYVVRARQLWQILTLCSIMGFPIAGQDYNLVSMAFYLGYLLWEFPTMYISQKLRLAKYLGANTIAWGALLMLHAATNSFGPFFALRFLLAPSLILIISMFYKKDEQASRISWFYVMNGLTQIFGGFVAFGVSFYDGKVIPPYKIVYLVLGGISIIVGCVVLIWLPDSPVHARMLTREERVASLERVRNDQGGTENKRFKKEQIIEAVKDIRTWLIVLTTLVSAIPNGALSNFGNIVIKSFGYTTKQTLILGTPSGAVMSVMVIFCGWYSDKKARKDDNERMVPIVIALIPTIVGAALLVALNGTGQKGALLFATYLMGTYGSCLSTIYAYNASNTSGHTKKAYSSSTSFPIGVTINALTMVTFSIGNIVGTEIFLPKDAPAYIPGKIAVLVLLSSQLFISYTLRYINVRLNKKRQIRLAEEAARQSWSEEDIQREREKHAFADLTDHQ